MGYFGLGFRGDGADDRCAEGGRPLTENGTRSAGRGMHEDQVTRLDGIHLPDQHLSSHRSEEHTSELQSHLNLVCRLLLEKKKNLDHTQPYRGYYLFSLNTPPNSCHTSQESADLHCCHAHDYPLTSTLPLTTADHLHRTTR